MSNRIIFDVDGVLADFILGYTKLGVEMGLAMGSFGTHSPKYTSWDIEDTISLPNQDLLWKRIKASPTWWTSLEPLCSFDVFDRIDKLQREHDVYFVTSRPGVHTKTQTEWWLNNHCIESPTVLVSSQKGEIALGLKATHAIDDKAGNCLYMKYHSPKTEVFILNNASNQFDHAVAGRKVKRIQKIEEFLEVVE